MSKYASQLFKRGGIPGSGWLRPLGINCLRRAATWRKLSHPSSPKRSDAMQLVGLRRSLVGLSVCSRPYP
jgi:hypothetical protein